MHTTGISKTVSAEAEVDDIGGLRDKLIEEKGTIYQFRQSQRETAPNLSQNNNPNFGRAVERERSELRNASPKERKSQV